MANEHIFNNSLIITGSVTSSVGFSGDGSGLTGLTAGLSSVVQDTTPQLGGNLDFTDSI